jgi:altronate dehydratase small subunit
MLPNRRGLLLDAKDNVVHPLEDVQAGEIVEFDHGPGKNQIKAEALIPFGFKMAIKAIEQHRPIIKYGQVIGIAIDHIRPGELVHVHNLAGTRGRGDLSEEAMAEKKATEVSK